MYFESEFPGSVQDVPLKNEQLISPDTTKLNPQDASSDSLRSPQAAQSVVALQEKTASPSSTALRKKSTPNVSAKRKPRKLAVNFGAPKSSE